MGTVCPEPNGENVSLLQQTVAIQKPGGTAATEAIQGAKIRQHILEERMRERQTNNK